MVLRDVTLQLSSFFNTTAAPKEKDSDGEEEKKKKKKDGTGNKDAKVLKKVDSKSTGERVFIILMVGGMLNSGALSGGQIVNHSLVTVEKMLPLHNNH